MSHRELLGRLVTLPVCRIGSPGAFLSLDATDPHAPTILLPRSEVSDGTQDGDELEVFVYLDSEGRPIATSEPPKILLGEVGFLAVTDVTPIGAFVDWGPRKQLLVPFAEQTREVRVGEHHPIGLYVDKSGRLAGTMRVSEMLVTGEFERDEWVRGEAWRNADGIGVFVIVERRFVGLLPAHEPHALQRGDAASFRVANVLEDGKIELSLRGHAHEELENDAAQILETLRRQASPNVGDRSSPERIRALFGLSKKAFKRAVGRLLKQGAVEVNVEGYLIPRAQRQEQQHAFGGNAAGPAPPRRCARSRR